MLRRRARAICHTSGQWSNDRGETLLVTGKTLRFADDKPVPYRDVTRATDGASFELLITARGAINAFPGKTLAVGCESDSMEMIGYASHAAFMQGGEIESKVTWFKDEEVGEGPASASSKQKAYTPATGSAERKAIALAIHLPCEKDLDQKVFLKFNQLAVSGDWAFARIEPRQPNGQPIDYRKTRFKEAGAEGMFDAGGESLLHREKGKWRLLEWSFGGTDTAQMEWIKTHRAPTALAR